VSVACLAPLRAARAQDAALEKVAKAVQKQAGKASSSQEELEAGRTSAKGAKKVLRLEELTVEGRIQKPQAFFILPRSNLNFDGGERRESLLPKTQRSLEKEPF
jgi:hypothetical protein